jgi:diguanylate cyclase (GGDEF)-like protein/PAS domain S-box-containing protein
MGACFWFLPWQRWPRRVSLIIVPVAFALIAASNMADPNPYTYGVYYLIGFLWIGVAQPRGTSLFALPVFGAAYVVPLLLMSDTPDFAITSGIYVGLVCLLTGETVAWVTAKVRSLEAEVAHTRTEARLGALVQHSSDLIAIVDRDGTLRYTSPAVTPILRRDAPSLVGTSLLDLLAPTEVARAQGFLDGLASGGSTGPVEWCFQLPNGLGRNLETIATNLLDDPDVQGIVLNSRDVTERKALEEQIVHRAFHDGLTGLANRALFYNRIVHAQARVDRDGGQMAVLFLDLDNFKSVNDSLGHTAGDLLLVAVAQRLQAALRASDTVARFGGDEFAILIEDVHDLAAATRLAEVCLAEFDQAFDLGAQDVFVHISIGVAMSNPGEPPDELLREADVALYAAKSKGKGRVEIFDGEMDARARERLQTEHELRSALSQGELRVYYQPIVSLADRSISGVEALARWQHPVRGLVSPIDFIPLAEETGLIVPIGQWVLEQACLQVRKWRDQSPALAKLVVSVNLSARQFQTPDLVQEIVRAASEAGLESSALKLEITESTVMHDPEAAATTLRQLKSLGFQLAIDDFGTGYSSLSYLKRFPVDTLKIDRSFVDGLGADLQDTAIVRSVVDLAQALDVTVTGEGIETAAQEAELRLLGCDGGQGFLFARPLPALELEALLEMSAGDVLDRLAA